MKYDLGQVRRLISDALTSSEVHTMAFDVTPDVYEDFSSGMGKSQMILAIVERADKQGRIPVLLDYIKQENRFQYDLYKGKLELKETEAQLNREALFGYEQRIEDLQRHIKNGIDLLREYETLRDLEDDPRRRQRHELEIARQKKALARYRDELNEIETGVSAEQGKSADEGDSEQLDEIVAQLAALQSQLEMVGEQLAEGQANLRDDLTQAKQQILGRMEAQEQALIQVFVEKMNVHQLEVTELLFDAADQQQLSRWDMEQLTQQTALVLAELKRDRMNHPQAAEWQKILDLLAQETRLDHKLRLTLPVIPGLVALESEIAVDLVPALNRLWQGVVDRVKSMRGG